MACQPLDYNRFFDALGIKYVRKAIISGEFSGDTAQKAEVWLTHRNHNAGVFLAIAGIVVAAAVAIAVGIYQPNASKFDVLFQMIGYGLCHSPHH